MPPNNKDAEESVLSAIMTFERDPRQVAFLSPDDFYSKTNQTIYKSIKSLSDKKQPIDSVSVCQKLNESGKLEEIGGVTFISSMLDSAPIAVNFTHYAQIVKDCAVQRQVINAAQKIVEAGLAKKTPAEELVSMAQSMMLGIKTTGNDDSIVDAETYADDGLGYIEEMSSGANINRLKTGFSQFDNVCNIIGPLLIVIAARPGIGKTAFAMSLVRNITRMDNMIGFLSLEMPKEQLFLRHIAIETGINLARFNLPKKDKMALNEKEKSKVYRSAEQISRLPLLMDDGQATIDDIERKCRIMVEKGAKGIFIDQLSKISGGKGSDTEKFAGWVNRLALLKKELKIPIFLLAQINRKVADRADKMPTLDVLKQTGALEEDADIIFFINRPGYYDDNVDKGCAEINLAKHRNGATWWHKQIVFNPSTTYYSESLNGESYRK